MTPLAAASREGYADIVEYLLAKGADPNADAPDWAKPLSFAQHRGHADVAKLLRRQTS
jgi:ankyrin repeat protein